ncbi:YigZ family protein [candidate division KSB1 bacterium]|nr:YigZ family protein [candidate division KSB1 bacterium]
MDDDVIHTIEHAVSNEYRVKGSRFIGHAAPIPSREEAEMEIERIQKKYHNATHHCFAYRIGSGAEEYFRYSDAGEPSGTAGKPIYHAILGRNLTNLVVVVTRYFGGIKLGTGGLARAYSETVVTLLQQAMIKTEYIRQRCVVTFSYDRLNAVMHVIDLMKADIVDSHYGSSVALQLSIRKQQAHLLQHNLVEATGGKIIIAHQE